MHYWEPSSRARFTDHKRTPIVTTKSTISIIHNSLGRPHHLPQLFRLQWRLLISGSTSLFPFSGSWTIGSSMIWNRLLFVKTTRLVQEGLSKHKQADSLLKTLQRKVEKKHDSGKYKYDLFLLRKFLILNSFLNVVRKKPSSANHKYYQYWYNVILATLILN